MFTRILKHQLYFLIHTKTFTQMYCFNKGSPQGIHQQNRTRNAKQDTNWFSWSKLQFLWEFCPVPFALAPYNDRNMQTVLISTLLALRTSNRVFPLKTDHRFVWFLYFLHTRERSNKVASFVDNSDDWLMPLFTYQNSTGVSWFWPGIISFVWNIAFLKLCLLIYYYTNILSALYRRSLASLLTLHKPLLIRSFKLHRDI